MLLLGRIPSVRSRAVVRKKGRKRGGQVAIRHRLFFRRILDIEVLELFEFPVFIQASHFQWGDGQAFSFLATFGIAGLGSDGMEAKDLTTGC